MLMNETWCVEPNTTAINECTPAGYLHRERTRGTRGGGLAIIYRNLLTVTEYSPINATTFEYGCYLVVSLRARLVIVNIYRPPSAANNAALNRQLFLTEFASLIDTIPVYGCPRIFTGDYNIHVNNFNDINATNFRQLLETSDLRQHVMSSTHSSGNILDLVITSPDIMPDVSVVPGISDHEIVIFSAPLPRRPVRLLKRIEYRNWKHMDTDAFRSAIQLLQLSMEAPTTAAMLESCLQSYYDAMTRLANTMFL